MRHNAELLRINLVCAQSPRLFLSCFCTSFLSARFSSTMVKIAFNSALAQKALGKEVPAAVKVS